MRWLLSLCFAGLVAYALIPPRVEPVEDTDAGVSTSRTEAAKAADRELRSWGSTLQSLGNRAQPAKSEQIDTQPSQQEAAYRPGGVQPESVAPNAQIVAAVAEPVAWARVAFAAKAHSEASISSPIIKFYPAGTELQVVAQEGAWIQLLDPATRERGWVFDQYLVSIDGPSQAPHRASTAIAQPEDAAVPDVYTVRQSSRKAAAKKKNEISRQAKRQSRWAKKQERRERKRRRASRRDARPAWSLGPSR